MLKSTMINQWALCLLLVCGSGFFTVPSLSQATLETSPCSGDRVKVLEDGRLQIPPLTKPLMLGEENEIPIQSHGYKVHTVNASWNYYKSDGALTPPDGGNDLAVMYHSDGSVYVKIVPEKLGKLQLAITACFEDGGIANAWAGAEVVYPDRKPEKVYVTSPQSGNRTSGTIYMDLSKISRISLFPKALYKGAAHPVPIPAKDVSFKLITATESDPPISIDESTGIIKALHIGHALIQTTFEGFTVLTCVDVMNDASDGSDRTVCSELVPAGMTAPLTGFEDSGPPPKKKPHK